MTSIKTNSVLPYDIFCNLYEYGDLHVMVITLELEYPKIQV